jgi:hypothetical protein
VPGDDRRLGDPGEARQGSQDAEYQQSAPGARAKIAVRVGIEADSAVVGRALWGNAGTRNASIRAS